MASQMDEREMKAPAGDEGSTPPKRICTDGNKDGEKDMQKTIELKRLEMLAMQNHALLNDFLAVLLSNKNSDLDTQPGNSASGTGSDGAGGNPGNPHGKDQSRKRREMLAMLMQSVLNDFLAVLLSNKNSDLDTQPGNSASGTGSDGAGGNPENPHGKDQSRKRREMLTMQTQSLVNKLLAVLLSNKNSDLDTQPGNSASGTGSDGVGGNPGNPHGKDQSRKRLEMSTRKKLGQLLDSIAAFVSYRKSDLASPPEKSPSGTGSDGADDNQDAHHGIDQLQKLAENTLMINQSLLIDLHAAALIDKNSDLASPPETSPSDNGPDGADDNQDDTHAKDKLPPQDSHDSREK
ncbi:hypothetical protein BOVATA_036570 [Babesia ovata]|uniref:Uncharacterized protein n=1 Tax=Babesia ovata TaxID=189622 RepID=A0A2H6KGQ5_9APIC|nr:uncharacterized protein BOVATA_036570 [Babesia ovata]GBE62164.1 hypothetical protein BOVATA_036570 [Babesia ovata]